MCGIAGMFGIDIHEIICKNMLNSMTRRGPDAEGKAIVGECALLHSRLTIIDPVNGDQPMALDWREKTTLLFTMENYITQSKYASSCTVLDMIFEDILIQRWYYMLMQNGGIHA